MKPLLHLLQIVLLAVLTLGLSLREADAAPRAPDAPAVANAQSSDDAPLRRLDGATPAGQSQDEVSDDDDSDDADDIDEVVDADEAETQEGDSHVHGRGSERVAVGSNSTLEAGERAAAVVSVLGSSTSAGEVAEAVVSVLGSSRVTGGSVGQDVVSVLGDSYVTAPVRGQGVAVMGNGELGPQAVVEGEIVCIGGRIIMHPGAVHHGERHNVGFGFSFGDMSFLNAWLTKCVFVGRLLGFGSGLGWAWLIAVGMLVFYLVLGLVAPRAVNRCAETLEQRPGYSLLTTLLTILLFPVTTIVLAITVVGAPLIPFIGLGLFFLGLFGKAVMLAWVGRRLVLPFSRGGALTHPAFTILLGGGIVMLLYTVPALGLIVYNVLGALGLGAVIYTIILAGRREAAVPPAVATAVSPGASSFTPPVVPAPPAPVSPVVETTSVPPVAAAPQQSASFVGAPEPVIPPPPPVPPVSPHSAPPAALPVVAAASLPRAGFWIRLGASALDALLVGLVIGFLPSALEPNFALLYAAYCIVMWALKGTTIGGIVCGLKLVRLDDRKIDWMTALVRGLGGFLSLIPLGFGFVWVSFDAQHQSWHDKIAGTTIVIVPKGVSLV